MFFTKHKTSLLALLVIAVASAVTLLMSSTVALAATTEALGALPVATEKVTNPYGLDALWQTGDFIAKGTLMILAVMSMGSWYIIVVKFIEQRKLAKQARGISDSFWKSGTVQGGVKGLEKGNAYGFIAESALEASQRHNAKLAESMDHSTWLATQIQSSTDKVQSRLQDGLAFLASVGSIAPFVGLFGTVWGIYHALTAIGIAGQASIDKVAGPVGEALIMTAIGLAVAVPAVLGYNWLVRRNKVAMEQVRDFGAEVHAIMIGASGKAS